SVVKSITFFAVGIIIATVTLLILHTCSCDKKPNFVIFLTDDQDVALDGMKPMKNVQRFIGNEGTTFTK
ncbi:unnamed protein product, partial [Leptidea sinapis]